MKVKDLRFISIILLIILGITFSAILSSCTPPTQEPPTVFTSVCGDGVCSADELRTCDIDCNTGEDVEPTIVTSEDILAEFRSRQRNYTPEERLEQENPVVSRDPMIQTQSFTSYLPEKGYRVASRYNLLSIGEDISDFVFILNKLQLREILRSGRLSSNTEAFGPRGAMYEQFFRLRAGKVLFGFEEDSELIISYLSFQEEEPVFDYLIELYGGIFKFFEGETINFLGHEYFIEEVTNSSMKLIGVSTPDTLLFRNKHRVWINNEIISNNVLNVSFGKDYLRIILIAQDDIRILPGTGLRNYLIEPEVMLTNRLDIAYEGLTNVPVYNIEFDRSRDKYKLKFTNNKNTDYTIPLVYLSPFKLGDEDNAFVFREGEDKDDYVIKEKDYFIISNNKEFNGLNTVLRLINVKKEDHLLTFEDPALEKFLVYFKGTPGVNATADLIVHNVLHKVYVGDDESISIDLNGNGAIRGESVSIVSAGNGIIRINKVEQNRVEMSFVTPAQMRENENTDLEISIIIDEDGLRIDNNDVELIRESGSDDLVGMTDYGSLLILKDYTDAKEQKGEDLIIKHPVIQRFADVMIRAYE